MSRSERLKLHLIVNKIYNFIVEILIKDDSILGNNVYQIQFQIGTSFKYEKWILRGNIAIAKSSPHFDQELVPIAVKVTQSNPKLKTILIPNCLYVLSEIKLENSTSTLTKCESDIEFFTGSQFRNDKVAPTAPICLENYPSSSIDGLSFFFRFHDTTGGNTIKFDYFLEFENDYNDFYFNETIQGDGLSQFTYTLEWMLGMKLGICEYKLYTTTIDNYSGLKSNRQLTTIFHTFPSGGKQPIGLKYSNDKLEVVFNDQDNCIDLVHYDFVVKSMELIDSYQSKSIVPSQTSSSAEFPIESKPGVTYNIQVFVFSNSLDPSVYKAESPIATFIFPLDIDEIDAYLVLENSDQYEIAIKDSKNSKLNYSCDSICYSSYNHYEIEAISVRNQVTVMTQTTAENPFAIIKKEDLLFSKGVFGGCLLTVYVGINSRPTDSMTTSLKLVTGKAYIYLNKSIYLTLLHKTQSQSQM